MKRSELYRKAAEYGFKTGNDGACVWIAQATRGGSYMFLSNKKEIEAGFTVSEKITNMPCG